MENANLISAARRIGAARIGASPIPDLIGEELPKDIAEGYCLQAAVHDYLKDETGSSLVGWKIGATTDSMQEYLGVDGPAYGRIMASNVHESGAALAAGSFRNPGIECEIGMRLDGDAGYAPYTSDTVGDIVGSIFPAIEIVENRYGDFLARGTPLLIADDFFHKACVLGDEITDWQDINLASVAGRTLIDGEEKGSGTGADVMGHPFEALAWLANTLNEHEIRLQAGQIVLTGSVAPVIWAEKDRARATIELDGLGAVSVEIA